MAQRYDTVPPTNLPEGMSGRLQQHPLGWFRENDPFRYVKQIDNFTDTGGGYSTSGTNNRWLLTQTGTAVAGLVDGQNGILSLATATGVSDSVGLRTQKKIFNPDATSDLFLYGRFSLSDVIQSVFEFGFVGTSYGIKIYKPAGVNQLYLRATTPSMTVRSFALSTRAQINNSTYFTVGLRFRWVTGEIIVYYNNQPDTTFKLPNAPTATPPGFSGSMPGELEYGFFAITNDGTHGQVTTLLTDKILFAQNEEPGEVYP